MKKVFIVIQHIDYEGSNIYAIFSTKNKAEKYIEKEYPNNKRPNQLEIEDWDVDTYYKNKEKITL